jgi:tetratricopeptide (TPR) repeat protein
LTRIIELDPGLTFFYVSQGERVVVIADELTIIAYLDRGSAYLAMHDTPKAVLDFSEVLSRQSERVLRAVRVNALAAAYYGRARAHAEGKKEDRAIADLDEAIKLIPGFVEAYAARSRAHWNKGAYRAAMADYLRAARFRFLPW